LWPDLGIRCAAVAGFPATVIKASINYNENLPQFVNLPEPPPPLPNDFPTLSSAGTKVVFNGSDGQERTFDDFNSNISPRVFRTSAGSFSPGDVITSMLRKGQLWRFEFFKGKFITRERLIEGVYTNIDNTNDISPSFGVVEPRTIKPTCLHSNQTFTIYEIAYNPSGELIKLFAEFSASCNNLSGISLDGYIAFDSTLPPPEFPDRISPTGSPIPELLDLNVSVNALNIISTTGDVVGNGKDLFLCSISAIFSNISDSSELGTVELKVEPNNGDASWQMRFTKDAFKIDPKRNGQLEVGVYADVIFLPFASSSPEASLRLSGESSCALYDGLQDSRF